MADSPSDLLFVTSHFVAVAVVVNMLILPGLLAILRPYKQLSPLTWWPPDCAHTYAYHAQAYTYMPSISLPTSLPCRLTSLAFCHNSNTDKTTSRTTAPAATTTKTTNTYLKTQHKASFSQNQAYENTAVVVAVAVAVASGAVVVAATIGVVVLLLMLLQVMLFIVMLLLGLLLLLQHQRTKSRNDNNRNHYTILTVAIMAHNTATEAAVAQKS